MDDYYDDKITNEHIQFLLFDKYGRLALVYALDAKGAKDKAPSHLIKTGLRTLQSHRVKELMDRGDLQDRNDHLHKDNAELRNAIKTLTKLISTTGD